MTTSALEQQVGGGHYKGKKIQPVEFAMANGWDFCASSALKYILRHQDKAGELDLRKAIHFGQLREELLKPIHKRGIPVIDVEDLISENGIECQETRYALRALSRWVYSTPGSARQRELGFLGDFTLGVEMMIDAYYPKPKKVR